MDLAGGCGGCRKNRCKQDSGAWTGEIATAMIALLALLSPLLSGTHPLFGKA